MTVSSLKLCIILHAVLTCAAIAQSRAGSGKLRLIVTDSFGGKVSGFKVTTLRDQSGREWRHSLDETNSVRLAFGRYTLHIESDAFLPYEGVVRLDRPETTQFVGLVFSGIENSPPVDDLTGSIRRGGDGMSCKLTGLYLDLSLFTQVGKDGTFHFTDVPAGMYLLACFHDSTIVGLRAINLRFGSTPNVVFGDVQQDGTP